ncbi:helix-turn-helix domain-containing protein [Rhodococcus sp. BS-15]|uniref:helix-turn-helix domain-containing protein n=1 Tax=Rhodococcus sp. BS-15 TaxID=1304954 RepID=UPI000ACBAD48|nr:helix-turn-helix domain-containing protein [Rhodococcus sp. BS-15]
MTEHSITGNERLATLLSTPDTAEAVGRIRQEMDEQDRAHAMGLAAIRQAAALTQTELATRMGVKQAAISGLETRQDLLLSTLRNYLTAAGATDITMTVTLGGKVIEIQLPSTTAYQIRVEPSTTEGTPTTTEHNHEPGRGQTTRRTKRSYDNG